MHLKTNIVFLYFLLTLFFTGLASATEPTFDAGIGAIGSAGAVFLDDAEDENDIHDGLYPGFAGESYGGGLSIDMRYNSLIGIEIDWIYSVDYGNGEIDSVDIEIGQSAFHVPIFLKLFAPSRGAQPLLMIGYDFVLPNDAEANVTNDFPGTPDYSADSSFYSLFTAGIGMEFKIPRNDIDLRIPFSFRAGFNRNTPETPTGRADWVSENSVLRSAEFLSEWQYQAMLTVGIQYFFTSTEVENPQ